MRVFNYYVICAALLTASVTQVNGREVVGPKSKSASQLGSKAAGCSPAVTITEFFVNNVRTSAETGGNTWYDRGNGQPYYEVPAGGRNHVVFAGALWMGGRDPASNLKLAAIQFRQDGNDYWPGPLSIDGAASTTLESCSKWDKHFLVSRQMVEIHRYYFTLVNQGLDPSEDPLFEEGYIIPQEILEWPVEGDIGLGQSAIVAPFADLRNPDTDEILTTPGLYEPGQGDYPLYDLDQQIDCRTRLVTDPVPLFGDFTMYWVFNDNGNIHSESQGQPIGMEIQAQMFGFTTNDEINNMTFVNYVLINRGTLTLNNTFFAQWIDTDLGNFNDDYVGCDVVRGLGYSYNGQDVDISSASGPGYGAQPPAVGVDFFEGPYQDADGINNLVGIGSNEALNGLGYFDTSIDPEGADSIFIDKVIDNERFGMRRFLYHSNPGDGGPPPTSDPSIAIEYYNMMQGIWKDGTPMTVGGIGYNPLGDNIPTDFMFPGTSDPLNWGTGGLVPAISNWTEQNPQGPGSTPNPFGDRRFLQSAGPFTLSPGQFNNITVGVVYARASTGGPFASVISLFQADDKAQALFENCFRLLSGPDAPELAAQELDKEVILYLRNTSSVSNNQFELYEELDPTIPPANILGEENDQFYRFQGYQVYQVRNNLVSVSQIDDEQFARLVYQGDIEDGIGQIVNYEFDENIGLPVPRERVNGADQGIQHSIRITSDRFASGDNRLVNFKKYYFIAVAYGYNNYEDYNPQPQQLSGQPFPFLRGRSSAFGGAVEPITVIPHKPVPEQGGTVSQTTYGDGLPITRLEGAGNGGNELQLTQESIDAIMSGSPYKEDVITYEPGFGPLTVKIIDPLNVKPARFHLKFVKDRNADGTYIGSVDDARWILVDLANPEDTILSERTIEFRNEQLLPEYGISVQIEQYTYPLNDLNDAASRPYPELLSAELSFSGENSGWLFGFPDQEGNTLLNWIRSGTNQAGLEPTGDACNILPDGTFANILFEDEIGTDDRQIYEAVLGGIFAPARLVAGYNCGPSPLSGDAKAQNIQASRPLTALNSVELFFTPDKSKWSRSAVFEMHWEPSESENGAAKQFLRRALSVDKNGLTQLDPGGNFDEATNFGRQVWTDAIVAALPAGVAASMLEYVQERYPSQTTLVGLSFGMSWFPGYAITPETGERQNIAFGENSFRVSDNGNDMIWNPTGNVVTGPDLIYGIVAGGEHYVYVFRNEMLRENRDVPESGEADWMPMYDNGDFIFNSLNAGVLVRRRVYRGLDWVLYPLLNPANQFVPMSEGLVPGNARISVEIGKPYIPYATTVTALGELSLPYTPINDTLELSENNWFPFYEFNTEGIETTTNVTAVGEDALALIDVVPNPYYAYSAYETSRIDNRVKFVNLPQECKIQIFAMNGTLVRILEKDDPNTFLEWDLQNERFIPIAGGMYLVHIQAPGLGERVLKFYAATRPTDLRNF